MTITFLGAGSTVFAKNVLGDILLDPLLAESDIRLYDIDGERLADTVAMMERLNGTLTGGRAQISAFLGETQRRAALAGSECVINAIQVGGYRPSTVIDFEIPKRYGLQQTIGDTMGIGGIFRGIRTLQVMFEIVREMEERCPGALLLNYANPMSIVTGGILRTSQIQTVGLCHSVQICVPRLLEYLEMEVDPQETRWHIAGINHMAWLLAITHHGEDLYPEIKRRARERRTHKDALRFELMHRFGYYVTESSEHNAEYSPFWIKRAYPHLIEEYHIPLDEYPRRCERQIEEWQAMRRSLTAGTEPLEHTRSYEYGAAIVAALAGGPVARIHGNVLNRALIPNLPADAVVEVPALVDTNGVAGTQCAPLPPGPAALNSAAIQVHRLTIEAARTGSRDLLYQAAFMDPHTAAELSLDEIVAMCDEMLEAHGAYCAIIRR
ncbi:MAG: alpha-glucosidase/alpha-galactosidase [Spirochaeta sp.]|jgi:alpha-galactosidase|nr:alpha-glucosidase/alpha-galactosidase [Spirochaeta sp.]